MASVLKVDKLTSRDGSSKITLNNMQSGFIIASSTIRNSTRTALSLSNVTAAFGGSFYKFRSDTIIIATCTVFGAGYNSGNCAVGLRLDSSWNFGVGYQYDGNWSSTLQTTIVCGTCSWSGISVGSHTMHWGWNTYNGSTTDRPFNYLNPNNSDDGRNQQMVSTINVYEVIA